MTDFEVAVPFLGDAISCLLVPKNKTNQNTKWHKMYVFFANALLCSIDTLRGVAPNQNQPARMRSGGCEFGAMAVARVVVPEASGKQVRKQASLKAAQACVQSGLARGAGGEPEARKRYDGELSGEIESQDTQPNNNAMHFGERERDAKDMRGV